jgi:hypothetical protein
MSSLAIGPIEGGNEDAGFNVGLGDIVGAKVGKPTILQAVKV